MSSMTEPCAPPRANVDASEPKRDRRTPLASRGTRLVAAFVDWLIMLVLIFPVCFLIGLALAGRPEKSWTSLILGMAIGILLGIATTGQSLGKRMMKIRIARIDGMPISFSSGVLFRAVVPYILGAIPTVGQVFAIVDILCIFRDDRRCLHDHIAGTQVVEARPQIE
jgi:uncharacterized RDD family membrane protein YckC